MQQFINNFNQLNMFRAIMSPILRNARLPAGSIVGALCQKLQTQPSAPEYGRNYRPKHVKLIEIVNKIIIVAYRWLFILLYQ